MRPCTGFHAPPRPASHALRCPRSTTTTTTTHTHHHTHTPPPLTPLSVVVAADFFRLALACWLCWAARSYADPSEAAGKAPRWSTSSGAYEPYAEDGTSTVDNGVFARADGGGGGGGGGALASVLDEDIDSFAGTPSAAQSDRWSVAEDGASPYAEVDDAGWPSGNSNEDDGTLYEKMGDAAGDVDEDANAAAALAYADDLDFAAGSGAAMPGGSDAVQYTSISNPNAGPGGPGGPGGEDMDAFDGNFAAGGEVVYNSSPRRWSDASSDSAQRILELYAQVDKGGGGGGGGTRDHRNSDFEL